LALPLLFLLITIVNLSLLVCGPTLLNV